MGSNQYVKETKLELRVDRSNLNDSRRFIERIYREGESIIPVHSRMEYRIQCIDKGSTYWKELTNSDLIYFNEYYELFKVQEYTLQQKSKFLKRKELVKK